MLSILCSFPLLAVAATALPALSKGEWEECEAHMDGEMPYYVPPDFHFSGTVRRYYVAAEIETWNYVPSGWDNWLGVPIEESWRAQTYDYIHNATRIGTEYDKALYRGYTDASFEERTEQPDWLGFQGPILRGEVGDMIEIMFVNKMDHFFSSIHSMGLFYTKDSEGSLYWNGTNSVATGDAVPPGGCWVYKWLVPEGSAPNRGQDSKLWSYHPYVSMEQDQDAGSFGPVIVYNPGKMESVMRQNREFVLVFADNKEWSSFLALHNARKYIPTVPVANLSDQYPEIYYGRGNHSLWYPQFINNPRTNITSDMAPEFYSINGYIYANNPPFEMCVEDRVIWYLYDMGSDTHVFHLHGDNTINPVTGVVSATVTLNPGQMVTVNMNAYNTGWWQLICHFTEHLSKGMEANYIIYGPPYDEECPLKPLEKA